MIKHKYPILGNIILFRTISVLFSVYNYILLSTLETSCGDIWNCLTPHVTWLALLKRNSDGAPLLENSPQTEGTRRILHKRRKWGEPSVFGGRKEYSTWGVTAELSSKGIPPEFRFWLTLQKEEMRRILHFRWIKGVLRLRRRRGKRNRFSCWAIIRSVRFGQFSKPVLIFKSFYSFFY